MSSNEFDVDFGLDPLPDLHSVLREIREQTGCARVRAHGHPATLITRYDDVRAAFRDEAAFPSSAFHEATTVAIMGQTLLSLTGPEHRTKRKLIAQTLKPSVVRALKESAFSEVAHALVDSFEPRGHADLVRDYTSKLSFTIMSRLVGIPPAFDDKLYGWVQDFFVYALDPERALSAAREFDAIMIPEFEARRSSPRNDLLTDLLEIEIDGEKLTTEEIMAFVKLLFPAGSDTTYLATGNLIHALLTHPESLQRVKENPGDRGKAIEELLRWDPPVTLQERRNPKALTWRGHEVDKGILLFGVSSANRDPMYFDDADRFDMDRKRATPPLTFGNGTHHCVGSHFARALMATALDVILDRLPGISIDDDEGAQVEGGLLRGPNRLPVSF